MSLWGVFENHEHEQHVMPSTKDGTVLNNHVAARDCWCKPVPDRDVPTVIVHNDPERGGFNA